MDFKIGQKYKGTTALGKNVAIEIIGTRDNNEFAFKVLEGNMYGTTSFATDSDFAKRLELVTNRPRICEVLGVEVGEHFKIHSYSLDSYIDADGAWCYGGSASRYQIVDAINHPE